MKRLIGAVMAVALLVSVAPVVAEDSFQALSRLPAGLTPMDDAQLAAVEGGYGFEYCFDCTNVANIYQSNWAQNYFAGTIVSVAGDDVRVNVDQDIDQSNEAEVRQEIN
jgi:hypothetical protein